MRKKLWTVSSLFALALLSVAISVYASSNTIWVGEIGTVLQINAAEDISGATAKNILLKKPSGPILNKTATWTTDGTDGKFEYQTVSGDIDTAGEWTIQGKLTFGSNVFYTAQGTFDVEAPIQ